MQTGTTKPTKPTERRTPRRQPLAPRDHDVVEPLFADLCDTLAFSGGGRIDPDYFSVGVLPTVPRGGWRS